MDLGKRVSKAPVRLVEDPKFGSQHKQINHINQQINDNQENNQRNQ